MLSLRPNAAPVQHAFAHRTDQNGRKSFPSRRSEPGVFLQFTRREALNLTTASYLHDPWWNPLSSQAIDRSHRIGQTRTVNAYRLIAPGTVEEKIWELQQRKAQAIADVLGEEGFAKSLSQTDLEYLFSEE
jgi:hypothetical protein